MNRVYQAGLAILALAGAWLFLRPGPSDLRQSPARGPLARVGGQPVYEDELLPLIQSQLRQLERQEYDLKRQALQELIQRKLTEAEANKRGITAEELFRQEVEARVADPADAEVEALYLAQKDRLQRPFGQVEEQLRRALKQSRLQEAERTFVQGLQAGVEIAVYLRPPKVEVGYDAARVLGDANAPVTIVEFSDFQCPFCQRAYPVVKALLAKYEGRVKLAYRDFPLREIHPQAQIASQASRCAGEQDKFWEYHDLLFENFGRLDKPALLEHAASLGLDRGKFDECLSSGKFDPRIEEDLKAGEQAGVSGTPAFFINGVFLNGAQPAAAFEKIIEEELAANAGSRPAQ
ncbi:MAG: thioredoxin domain-containing protein [Terriglobia bacterium]